MPLSAYVIRLERHPSRVLLRGRRAPGSAHLQSDASGSRRLVRRRPRCPARVVRTLTSRVEHSSDSSTWPSGRCRRLTVRERGTNHGSHQPAGDPCLKPQKSGGRFERGLQGSACRTSHAGCSGRSSELRTAPFPVVVVFAGVDGAGKGETVNLLNEWMDPRWIVTRAFGEPSDEERERPAYWRFWRALPPRGRIGLFLSSWYSRPSVDRVVSPHAQRRVRRAARTNRRVREDARRRWRADPEVLDAPRTRRPRRSG